MKKILLFVSALFSLSFIANAQSLDKALERLETVRSQKGEQSQEYLTALDTVIWAASMTGDNSMAISYRQHHLDIARLLKGENCFEVADDIWRLGNTSFMLGDSIGGCNYYAHATELFDKVLSTEHNITDEYLSHYSNCLYRTFSYYYAKSDIEAFTNTVKKYERIKDKMRAFNPCYNIMTLYHFSYSYELVGDIEKAKYYSNLVVNSCNSIDSCNYQAVLGSYSFLKSYYYTYNEPDSLIMTAKKYLQELDKVGDDFLNEKIDALLYLLVCNTKDIKEAIECGKRAEQLLSNQYSSKDELFKDKRYYKIISHIALLYDVLTNFLDELPYRLLCLEVLEHNGETHTKNYYDEVFSLFSCAIRGGDYPIVFNLAAEIEPMIFKYSDNPTQDALIYTSLLSLASSQVGKYDDAIHFYDETISLLPAIKSGDDLTIAIVETLSNKAEVYNIAGRREEAKECLDDCKKRLSLLPHSDKVLSAKIPLYQLEGQLVAHYDEAMALFDSAFLICNYLTQNANETISSYSNSSNTISLSNSSSLNAELEPMSAIENLDKYRYYYAITLISKGKTQAYFGKTTEAYQRFVEAASILKQSRSSNSMDYIGCLLNISYCQMELANYSDAINTIDATMHLISELYGVDNPHYSGCLQNYALYYHRIGAQEDALRYSEEVVRINKKLFGENSFQYSQSLGNLAGMYLSLGMTEKANQLLSEVFMLNKSFNNVFPASLDCKLLTTYSLTLFELGRFEEGWQVYEQAKELTESVYGWDSRANAKFNFDFGVEMLRFKKGEEVSYESFLTACGIMYSIGNTSDPLLLQAEFWYGVSALAFQKPIALDYIPLICKATKDYYYNNFVFFPSKERDLIWSSLSDITKVIFSTRLNNSWDLTLYDHLLFSKSLLVSTSNNFQQAVFSTEQEDIINQFNDIQALQRSIDNQDFGVSLDNQTASSPSSVELYERKTSMERKLIAEMKSLGYSVVDSVSYKDVVSSLKPDEIAIEFGDYYHLLGKQTYYVALLAKTGWDKPVYVQLCTEDELKACLGNPNVTYSTVDLYRLLWQPLSEYIDDSSTVYFSPSGMLHTIALESIHTPDGLCLSDKYNLVRLTSTRELCKEKQTKTYETGAVYGGLQYDVEQQRMAEVAAMNKTELEERPAFALRGEDRGNWNYLQGTKDEAEHIAGIMQQANIGYNLYEGDLGSEESFKALSGGNTDIIHLATHGYFLEGEKADMNDFMQSLSPLARQKTDSVIDPLLRSGLIMSGGNSAWLGKEVPEGIEDGVLTALEISTMNLSGTDMVVMSACETGLGDITSDGVFGLQRAFKMAGVQTLVMSLWKVDDNATSLMMQTFYEHLLSGMSKREAFNLAQAAVRAKYTEPYYWAGFVMLD